MKSPKFLLSLLTIACGTFSLAVSPDVQANEVKGVEVPEELVMGEDTLLLNGTALRKVYKFVDVYVAALYLTECTEDENAIMTCDNLPKRVHMTMLREVPAKKFGATVRENIGCNFSAKEMELYEKELSSFLGCFGEDLILVKDDVVNIDYVPGKGTVVQVEGQASTIIPGDEFYHAILRLWIGKPLQEAMKPGLLGKAG